MKSEIVKDIDVKKVAEFLVNQEKERLMKEWKEGWEKEKPDDIQSLELLLGMKVIALWVDNASKEWNNAKLNIRCLNEVKVNLNGIKGNADVEMTIVWDFKEIKDFKPLDFMPEESK
jgi:hypothetical protein